MQHKIKIREFHRLDYRDDAKRFVGRRCDNCKTGISDGGYVQRAYIADSLFRLGMKSKWLHVPHTQKPECTDCYEEHLFGPTWVLDEMPFSAMHLLFPEGWEDDM